MGSMSLQENRGNRRQNGVAHRHCDASIIIIIIIIIGGLGKGLFCQTAQVIFFASWQSRKVCFTVRSWLLDAKVPYDRGYSTLYIELI